MSQFYFENSIHSKDKINNLILCTIKFKKSVKLFFLKNKIQIWRSESLTYFASNCIHDPQDGSFEDLDLLLSSERCLDRFQLRQADFQLTSNFHLVEGGLGFFWIKLFLKINH